MVVIVVIAVAGNVMVVVEVTEEAVVTWRCGGVGNGNGGRQGDTGRGMVVVVIK